MSNQDKLSNWTRFRPSLCRGCAAGCCRLPVEATSADLVRLEFLSPDEGAGPLKKLARHLITRGLVRQFRASSGVFTLAQKPDGDCILLGADRLCTVYDKRPNTCRRFPEVGPRPGFCPASRQSQPFVNK